MESNQPTATVNVYINNCVVESTAGVFIYPSNIPVLNSGTTRVNPLGTLSITNSIFTGSMTQAILNNGTGTAFTSYNIVNNYFKGFTGSSGVFAQQASVTATALFDHCTFDASAAVARDIFIKPSTTLKTTTTIKNTIFANSANITNANQFGWYNSTTGALDAANKCAVYNTAGGTLSTLYPGYANAILNTNPSIDNTSHYATDASYLVGANPGTDGKPIGYYNATPDAPTSVTATGGNTQASIAFTAPSSDGGSAITTYRVTSSPGGFTNTGASSPIVVTGLSNGTAYTFTVVAANANGTGTVSSASNSVTPSAGATATITTTGTLSALI